MSEETMHIISVNTGLPRPFVRQGRTITTGIVKQPVDGSVAVGRLHLEGDGQADPSVHGGVDQAVYVYPAEHYDHWRREHPELELPWGVFGENLTTRGLLEMSVCVGDHLCFGDVELMVTAPRQPCLKLELRLGLPGFAGSFRASGLTGFYLRVIREGRVAAGDTIERGRRDDAGFTIAKFNRLCAGGETTPDVEGIQQLLALEALPEFWRLHFQGLIGRGGQG